MNQMFDVAIQHTQEKHHKPSCTNCNAKRRGFPAGFFSDHCNRFWQVEHAKGNWILGPEIMKGDAAKV
jgi:hypothetical protein